MLADSCENFGVADSESGSEAMPCRRYAIGLAGIPR
jgi:hypothetical protein